MEDPPPAEAGDGAEAGGEESIVEDEENDALLAAKIAANRKAEIAITKTYDWPHRAFSYHPHQLCADSPF